MVCGLSNLSFCVSLQFFFIQHFDFPSCFEVEFVFVLFASPSYHAELHGLDGIAYHLQSRLPFGHVGDEHPFRFGSRCLLGVAGRLPALSLPGALAFLASRFGPAVTVVREGCQRQEPVAG